MITGLLRQADSLVQALGAVGSDVKSVVGKIELGQAEEALANGASIAEVHASQASPPTVAEVESGISLPIE